jgi:translation initiation factor IF-2
VSGWDCRSGADYGFMAQGRTSSWYTVARGGWAQNGCDGTFESIPMTSSKAIGAPDQSAEWWFTPPAAMTRCAVNVFRPAPAQWQDSAATAAQFLVLDGPDGTPLGAFVLDEAADPGSWAAAGTFPVSQNGIAVELVDRGVSALAGARLAITQVKVVCTGWSQQHGGSGTQGVA